MEGLFANPFLATNLHDGLVSLLGFPQDADLLFSCIPFRFHLSGFFLWAQANFSSGTVQFISTISRDQDSWGKGRKGQLQ
jgi:hypothetical protein